jgi:transposase
LYKNKSKWTPNQIERAGLLFELYPDIQKGYSLTQELRGIFEHTTDKINAFAKLAKWHEKVNQSAFKSFGTISDQEQSLGRKCQNKLRNLQS